MKSTGTAKALSEQAVAPARERGLKFVGFRMDVIFQRRSREGAWIEIKSYS